MSRETVWVIDEVLAVRAVLTYESDFNIALDKIVELTGRQCSDGTFTVCEILELKRAHQLFQSKVLNFDGATNDSSQGLLRFCGGAKTA